MRHIPYAERLDQESQDGSPPDRVSWRKPPTTALPAVPCRLRGIRHGQEGPAARGRAAPAPAPRTDPGPRNTRRSPLPGDVVHGDHHTLGATVDAMTCAGVRLELERFWADAEIG